jgi:hypothetical protein
MFLDGQKCHPDSVFGRSGQLEAELRTFTGEELVWDLNQNASAVAGFRIAAASAAVREIDEDLNSLLDDVVAFFAANASDKSNAASVVFVRRVIKSLGRREAVL